MIFDPRPIRCVTINGVLAQKTSSQQFTGLQILRLVTGMDQIEADARAGLITLHRYERRHSIGLDETVDLSRGVSFEVRDATTGEPVKFAERLTYVPIAR